MSELTRRIEVDVANQQLILFEGESVLRHYPIGTASKGTGQRRGSEQTPLGRHQVMAKIGANVPATTVFVGREPTGEQFSIELEQQQPDRDWILARILWLAGLEPGQNQGGKVDTQARFIYIHGSPDSVMVKAPASHGCINMYPTDIIELFDLVDAGIEVNIHA